MYNRLPKLSSSTEEQKLHPMQTQSLSKAPQRDIDRGQSGDVSLKQPCSQFRMNERVVVHDRKGIGVHGIVRWIEKVNLTGERVMAIGIETVRYCTQSCMYVYTNILYGANFCIFRMCPLCVKVKTTKFERSKFL